ncbi:hypothetical protein A2U01_0031859, partial [Trifolium medium]|nr:hypothetical protein [Trifolium medium]
KKPNWIGANSWPDLTKKWDEIGFQKKCKKATANRASDNRGGSIPSGGQTYGATFRAQYFKDN